MHECNFSCIDSVNLNVISIFAFRVLKLHLELITVAKVCLCVVVFLSNRFTLLVNRCKNSKNTFSLTLPEKDATISRFLFNIYPSISTHTPFLIHSGSRPQSDFLGIEICCAHLRSKDERCFWDPATFLLRYHHPDLFPFAHSCSHQEVTYWFLVNPLLISQSGSRNHWQ